MSTIKTLAAAAQAVLDRWNSPKWEWHKQGPTADLMADLRRALDAPTEGEVIDWIERNHTLHRKVEALYVVDGYEVTITHDDERIAGPWHGETLLDAYRLAMAHWDKTHGERDLLAPVVAAIEGKADEGERLWGVNQLGSGKWCAWTAVSINKSLKPGSFVQLSEHDEEQQAHDAANEARAAGRIIPGDGVRHVKRMRRAGQGPAA
jgi:hypothetical protein